MTFSTLSLETYNESHNLTRSCEEGRAYINVPVSLMGEHAQSRGRPLRARWALTLSPVPSFVPLITLWALAPVSHIGRNIAVGFWDVQGPQSWVVGDVFCPASRSVGHCSFCGDPGRINPQSTPKGQPWGELEERLLLFEAQRNRNFLMKGRPTREREAGEGG